MNKYLTKIAEQEENKGPTTWRHMGMSRNTYGTVTGALWAPSGAVVGAAVPAFALREVYHKQLGKHRASREEAEKYGKSSNDAWDAVKREREEQFKNTPKSKSKALVPHVPGTGEYISKHDKVSPLIDKALSDQEKYDAASKAANKYLKRAKLTTKVAIGTAIGGAALGGYGAYKGGKYLAKKEWDYNDKYYGGDE